MALQLASALTRIDGPGQEQTWDDMPPPLLAHILQYVPQQRLTVGALVCKSWATAAAVASVNLQQRVTKRNSPGFESWLAAHAGQMVSIQLEREKHSRPWGPLCDRDILYDITKYLSFRLPWTQLLQFQCLHLTWIKMPAVVEDSATHEAAYQQGSASTSCTPAGPLLPYLKDLQLNGCCLERPEALVSLVSQAPGLTRLVFSWPRWEDPEPPESIYHIWDAATKQRCEAAMCSMLQLLPQIITLQLPGMHLSNAACQHLSAMSSLQDLEVTLEEGFVTGCVKGLPNTITKLVVVDSSARDLFIMPVADFVASLQLTALLQLELTSGCLLPAVLGDMTRLQHVNLRACELLPSGHNEDDTSGTSALLGALAKLTSMQHLELFRLDLDTVNVAPQHFAALTASTHLTLLRLVSGDRPALPLGAAQHMFPAGKRWPQLHTLVVGLDDGSGSLFYSKDSISAEAWCLDTADLGNIINSCQALHSLDILGTVRPGADLSVLLQLSESCRCLQVGGSAFADQAAPVLAQLHQLKSFRWWFSPGLTDAGLGQLTALTALTS